MKIGVDIDEVLVNLISGFFDYYFIKFEKKFLIEEVKDYYFGIHKMMSLDNNHFLEILDDFYKSELFESLELVDFAIESVVGLTRKHDIFFITSRKEEWRAKTLDFFKKHFSGHDFEVIFSGDVHKNQNKNKEEICLEKGIKIIIEDSAEHSPTYADKGIKVLLMDKPWNQDVEHENIIRVKDWKEVLLEISKIENG